MTSKANLSDHGVSGRGKSASPSPFPPPTVSRLHLSPAAIKNRTQSRTTTLTHLLPQRSAVKVDWTRITSSLGLKGQTSAQLLAFKKRADEARRRIAQLSEQPTTLDMAPYRAVLKNQSVIDEIEKAMAGFKPQTVDVGRQIRLIEEFEKKALKGAEETRERVREELKSLEGALENIRSARPVEDLTVVSFCSSCSGDDRWIFERESSRVYAD